MKILTLLIVAMMAVAAASAQKTNNVPVSPNGEYGEYSPETYDEFTLDEAVDGDIVEEMIQLRAKVTEVCASEGCWMVVTSSKNTVRVLMKDHDFFVPSSLVGTEVLVQGMLMKETISEKMRRHYAEDAGTSDEEIAKIVGDQTEYTFEAAGVKAL
jgi:hypothetical protein